VQNILEEAVRGTYDSLLATNPHHCGCTKCREDVIALALNQTRARYVVGNALGAALTRVALSGNQMQAELSVLVLDAMRRVDRAPRHQGGNGGSAH
jgi:competence protein ComFB